MKKLTLLLLVSAHLVISAQKADVDNLRLDYNYANLPNQNIEVSNRTFFISTTGTNSQNVVNLPQTLRLYGWENVAEPKNAALEIKFTVRGMDFGLANNSNRKVETKDKDGKVTGTTFYYKVSVNNTGRSELYVYGPENSYANYLQNLKRQEKAKDNKKEQKKMQEEANNPFLSKVNKKVVESNGGTKPLSFRGDMSRQYFYSTNEHLTAEKASKEYSDNARREARNHENQYLNDLPSIVESQLNNEYGFTPGRARLAFKKLSSDKHPEFTMFKNATDAMKVILDKTRYNLPIDEVAEDLEPILDYFTKLEKKLKRSGNKDDRRLRMAALYNLAQLYYILDQHENAIITCNAMVEDDLERREAEDMIKRSEETFRKLTFFDMKTRRLVPINERDRLDEIGKEVLIP